MKKMLVTAAVSLAFLGSSTAVQAEDISFYTGLGVGAISVDYKAVGIDQKNASVGGYGKFGADVNEYFAAEMRIGMTGKEKQTYAGGTTLSFSSPTFISYLAKVKFPVTPDFDVFALAGGTTAKIKGVSAGAAGTLTQSKTKTGASFGLGADYMLDSNISIGAEWVQYLFPVKMSAGSVFSANSEARMWGITGTVTYHF